MDADGLGDDDGLVDPDNDGLVDPDRLVDPKQGWRRFCRSCSCLQYNVGISGRE